MKFSLKATQPPKKNGIFEKKNWLFWLKNAIFSENFGDLSGLSQICNKIFLNPYPPPTIFGQAHVCIQRFDCIDGCPKVIKGYNVHLNQTSRVLIVTFYL
jgi:hypothetical protein